MYLLFRSRSSFGVYKIDAKTRKVTPLRILIASKQNAPLDNNTSLVLKGDVLCTANLGFVRATPQQVDRTVVCMKGFALPQ